MADQEGGDLTELRTVEAEGVSRDPVTTMAQFMAMMMEERKDCSERERQERAERSEQLKLMNSMLERSTRPATAPPVEHIPAGGAGGGEELRIDRALSHLPWMKDGDDAGNFVASFEGLLRQERIPRDRWRYALISSLSQTARDLVAEVIDN